MGSDERAKDEREQSSVNEGLRLVALAGLLCFALRTYATLPSKTAFRDATQLDERRGVELELFELEQRQRGIDRELRDLGAAVAATEDAWRGAAAGAGAPAAAAAAPPRVAPPRARDAPPAPVRAAPPDTAASPFPAASTWGPRGPPPDGFFDVPRCAPLGNATGSEFHWYGTPPAKACDRARVSLRLEPSCASEPQRGPRERRQFLVTGVQRSGTHFTWEMLNRLGIHSHHEGLGPAGSISWLYAWRARSYAIDNPTSLGNRRFCVVLHQVRHPLRVISSVVKATKPRDRFWDWIYTVEPKISPKLPPIARSALLWLRQNELIETYADARFKVEETSPRDVCVVLGFPDFLCRGDGSHHATSSKVVQPILEPRKLARAAALAVESKTPSVSWADLEALDAGLAADCLAMAERYGYDRDPKYHPQSLDTSAFKA